MLPTKTSLHEAGHIHVGVREHFLWGGGGCAELARMT